MRRRCRRGCSTRRTDEQRPRDRQPPHAAEGARTRLLDVVIVCGRRFGTALLGGGMAHRQADPRDGRDQGEDGPEPERDMPVRGIRHRHRHEGREERRERHRRGEDGGHEPDAIGEVPLHERRQQDVAHPDRGEDQRRARQQQSRARRQAADDQPDRDDDDRDDRQALEPEPPLEGRRQQAEDGVADRRRGADQADDGGRHVEVGGDVVVQRRQRGDRRTQREGEQHDADEGERSTAPEGRDEGELTCQP